MRLAILPLLALALLLAACSSGRESTPTPAANAEATPTPANESTQPAMPARTYEKPGDDELRKRLSKLEYEVTQRDGTERPFENRYWDYFEPGLYVDIVTGEPLFSSLDKFESTCGWPCFAKAAPGVALVENRDESGGFVRIEVRSPHGDSHLGHLFFDGPRELGGKRY